MCGIVGILNRNPNENVDGNLIKSMTDIIAHRGPDDSGVYLNRNIGLGHRRLSVIDLETGHQPMIDRKRGNVLVYNGEIYNFQALKSELIRKDLTFYTFSDTEVLLNLLDCNDVSWLESLNGMFAFAFWDGKTKTLFLARDRLGIKPLYYVNLHEQFLFASEIKALLMHPLVRREVNAGRIPEYLAYRDIAGCETLFKDVYHVPPGHVLILRPDDYIPEILRYWKKGLYNDAPELSSEAQRSSLEQFSDILSSAVRLRLISDVPLGTYNSGGVDSSLVSSIVKSHKVGELHTFSVGFEEKSHDERKYAQIVAEKLKTIHHTFLMNENDFSEALIETIWHLEAPLNHAHSPQILYLSKMAKEFVTVILTGEGADELFAGYPRYRIPLIIGRLQKVLPDYLPTLLMPLFESLHCRRLVKLMEVINDDEENLVINNSRFVPLSVLRRVVSGEKDLSSRKKIYSELSSNKGNIIDKLLYYDQRTYLSSILMRLDKLSMAAGVEARVPFLDYRLIEWSYLTPTNMKLKILTNKWIVKKAAEQWLPKAIVHRKKVGFSVPIANWLRNPKTLGKKLELLQDKTAKERGYFDHNIIKELIREHLSNKRDHSEVLWGLLNLELWHRVFIDCDGIYK